jgi:CheY-like chemotaxis protein
VIWNLLSNAIKFTPTRGRVSLIIRKLDHDVEIIVRDTGEGIAPGFVAHVFDRFRQADSSTTRPHGGLGLGLAIARSIVELHGGRIEAASSGEGHGATFRVRLPLAAFAERRRSVRRSVNLEPLAGSRVLVLDDQDDERELLSTIFGQHGKDVRSAGSVPEAFEVMLGWTPDLIVSDLAMPGEDGYAFIRRIRSSGELRNVAALAVTAHARPEDRETALASGFDAYVSKPIDREKLLATAVMLLERRNAAEQRDPSNER